ncbi:hypothetical protein LP420_10950 [Massilia sp. B-10]|nr:hypothetical protein LP420_10950 [Massilia sp. B-10]
MTTLYTVERDRRGTGGRSGKRFRLVRDGQAGPGRDRQHQDTGERDGDGALRTLYLAAYLKLHDECPLQEGECKQALALAPRR